MRRRDAAEAHRQFIAECPNTASALDLIFRALLMTGQISCRDCGSAEVERVGDRNIICHICRHEHSFTRHTFFHGTKAVHQFVEVIWFILNGHNLASSMAHEIIGIAQSTALSMRNKVLASILSLREFEGTEVSVAECFEIIFRRDRFTPAASHPLAAVQQELAAPDLTTDGAADRLAPADSQIRQSFQSSRRVGNLSEAARAIALVLSRNPLTIDQIVELSAVPLDEVFLEILNLEFNGIAEMVDGGKYVAGRNLALVLGANVASDAIGQRHVQRFVEFCREANQGVGYRLIALYAALFWCHIDAQFWRANGNFVGSLSILLRSTPARERQIRDFRSSPRLRLPGPAV